MKRTSFLGILAIAGVIAAVDCGGGGGGAAPQKAAVDSTVAQMRNQMNAVDDTIQRVLGGLDSGRAKIEVRLAESAHLHESLQANAPGVLTRLDAFVSQYKALQAELRAKDDTIKQLRDKYQGLLVAYAKEKSLNAKLQSQVDSLKADTAARSKHLAQVDSARVATVTKSNVAHYLVGTRKALEVSHIIHKLEKLGRLSVDPSSPLSSFTSTDVTSLKELPITAAANAVEVVSLHPADSYTIDATPTGCKLVIKDPDAFWSTTRRLVVMIK